MAENASSTPRFIASIVLVGLCAFSTVGGVMANWAYTTSTDTDSWTEATAPILGDGDIISAVSGHLADRALETVDISELGADFLPDQLEFLSDGAEAGARFALVESIGGVLRQPGVTQALAYLNREAHEIVVPVLLDEHEYFRIDGDDLVVDLSPVLSELTERVNDLGLPIWEDGVPEDVGSFVITTSDKLGNAQDSLFLLRDLRRWLPILALLSAIGALVATRDRVRTTMFLGLLISIVSLGSLALQSFAGVSLVSRTTDSIDELLGQQIWDIATAGLVTQLLGLAAAGLALTMATSAIGATLDARAGKTSPA